LNFEQRSTAATMARRESINGLSTASEKAGLKDAHTSILIWICPDDWLSSGCEHAC
jgi:hypothetical protein